MESNNKFKFNFYEWERKLKDKPVKLEELSKKFNISRERVRQIEEKAFEKLQKQVSAITQ